MKKILIFPAALAALGILAFAFFHFHGAKNEPAPAPAEPVKQVMAPVVTSVAKETPKPKEAPKSDTLIDHKAAVFHVIGDSKIQKKGSGEWVPLKPGDPIEEKDRIQTGKDAFVEINYDEFFLNTARVGGESLAEFYTIEPTQVYLRYGEIYNTLDGLPKDMRYDVGTNLAVAAIRGTRFVRKYDKAYFADTTLVSSGVVRVNVGEPGGSNIPPLKTFDVQPNQALTFNQDEIKSGNAGKLEVKELSLEEMDQMNNIFGQVESDLAEASGGATQLAEAREKWQALLGDKKEMEAFEAKSEIANFSKQYDQNGSWREEAKKYAEEQAATGDSGTAAAPAPAAAAGTAAPAPAGTAAPAPAAAEAQKPPAPKKMTLDELVKQNNAELDDGRKVLEAPINVCAQRPESCPQQGSEEFCKRFPDSPNCKQTT